MFSRELEIIKNFDKKLENEKFSTQRCLYWKIPNKNCYGKGRMVTKVSERGIFVQVRDSWSQWN